MSALLDIARGYVSAGLSVIRVRADGTKAPADTAWRTYSDRRPTDDELQGWFNDDTCYGIGVPGGPASGNLAVLDFETWAAWEEWFRSLPEDTRELTRKCPLAKPPGGGAHLYVRLPESVPGVVLARRIVDGRPKTLIEVRGEGHQVLAPGCPAECHPSGKLYEWLRPGWTEGGASEVTAWETWFDWIDRAAALNTVERPAHRPAPDTRDRAPRTGLSPGEDFNRRGTWEETGLFSAGKWAWHRELGDDRGFVRRPGKAAAEGLSGTVGMVANRGKDWPLFYVFTTDAHPFEHQQSYSRFRVYAILNHAGDFGAAAKALAAKGYGDQSRSSSKPQPPVRESAPASTSPPVGEVCAETPPPSPPANPGAKPPLPITYFDEITPSLDASDFVEGLLIDGTMSVIYGDSNTGKTFFALDLALHVAAGRSWRGREVDRRGVLYLALEGSYGIRNRISAAKQAMLINVAELPLAVVPVAIDLLSPEGDTLRVVEAAKLAAERLTVPVGLIVVDTLARAIAGGNENSSEDMGALVRNIDLIRQALPAHVAVVHHTGKDAARGARGHSSLRAATDTEIEITRDLLTKTSSVRVSKQRDLDGGDEFAFQLVPVDLGTNRRGKVVTSCVVRPVDPPGRPSVDQKAVQKDQEKKRLEREQSRQDEAAVLLVIDAEAAKGFPGASLSWIGDKADCPERRAREAVERLLDRGELVHVPPFTKPSGKGARTEVSKGVGRPVLVEQASE